MDNFESLSHTAWDCKYHVIFIPKRRRRTLYWELHKHLGEVFRKLAAQNESRIVEGRLGSSAESPLNFVTAQLNSLWAKVGSGTG